MKRRTYLIITATAATALGSWGLINLILDLFLAPVTKPVSLSLILDDKALISIGRSYRKIFPEEVTKKALLEQLEKHNANSAVRRDDLEGRISEDFELGNTLVIDGWVLSVTEARQCALFSTAT